MRENVALKGRRYLCEGRLVVRALDEHGALAQADCRGDSGSIYALGYDGRWFCNCAARGNCAHLVALRLVVALEPREAT